MWLRVPSAAALALHIPTRGTLDILSSVNPTVKRIPTVFSLHPKSQPQGHPLSFLLQGSSPLT